MSNLTIFGKNRTAQLDTLRRSGSGAKRQRKLGRAIPGFLESLEGRQLMSLLGVAPQFPNIFFDTTGKINYTYNPATQEGDFAVTATPHFVTFSNGAPPATVTTGTLPDSFTINFLVDGNGNLIGGQSGPNLVVDGRVTNPLTHQVYDGVLLQGNISQFGFQYTGTTTNNFDYRFSVDAAAPGLLGPQFGTNDIGVTTLSKGNTFTGDFTQNFVGGADNGAGANGNAGPIPPLPSAPPPSSITGMVFEDLDNNGIFNNTDVPLPNVQVTLTGIDYLGNPVNTSVLTALDGSYIFNNLAPSGPNGYTVTENQATVPAPLLEGMDNVGSLGGNGAVQDVISNIQVPANVAGNTYDFGEVPPSQISGNVYYDANNNGIEDSGEPGIPGVTVTLTGTDDNGNPISLTTTTLSAPDVAGDQIGYYQFTGLPRSGPGGYTITETQPAGYGQGIDTAGTGFVFNSQVQDVYNVSTPAILPAGGAVGTQYNFGELLGSLSGIVFFDSNDNGIQDAGEANLPGIQVELLSNNTVISTTSTDVNGAYSFGGLLGGTYQVLVGTQNGESFTIQTPYQNGGSVVNSIVSAAGLTPLIALAPGGTDTNVDAGLLPATPTINTSQQPATAVVGSSIADQATVSGGFNPTGSVTFELFNNIAGTGTPLFTDANVALVNGMATSVGYTATATGTDYWVAIYNGDSNNASVTSPAASEPVAITPATPMINTSQQPATAVVGSSIADKATVSGGFNPTGSVTFELFNNIAGTGTPLFTQANVALVNGMATSVGYTATATGTDYWVAIYNGDSNNASVTSPAASEPVAITPATPMINTSQQPANAVVGSSIADQATVSGGFNPTGSVTFELFNNIGGAGTPLFTDANVALVNGMATSVGYTATATGTDYWVAIYNGDSNNASVTSPAASEPVAITPATPMINTAQQPANAVVGSSIADKATVSGGFNPTGSVTFELFNNIAGTGTPLFTDANVALVNGMATSVGYTATATGTDYWVAIYNGDSNNASVTSPTASEPVAITPATPMINTSQQPANAVVGSSIADQATVSGGFNPTGSVTFELFNNIAGTGTPLFTDANVALVNGMATSVGYTATATGTDYWVAIYNGDSNNASVTSPAASEPVAITPATPMINTSQQPATAVVGSSIADKATVSGGFNPTGSVTFELFNNIAGTGTPLFTQANVALVNGMATSVGYTATATGTDYWIAIYNGDSNNASVTSPAASEPVVITPATPMINTSQQPATAVVGSSIADKATVSGGFNPTGSVTFELFNNIAGTGTPLFTQANVVLVNGAATSVGYTATATGTDYWVAIYNGDSNNASVTSPAASEPVAITPATPMINTSQQPANAVVGSSIADKATVSGGFNPTGSVTFELFNNIAGTGTPLFTQANVVLVNGAATSVGYTATATGTDYWVAIYNGDSKNSSVTSPAASEPVVITPATPMINTSQQPANAVVGSSIADKATVSGGFNPTGSVTFELFNNIAGTGTPLFTQANVALVNGMATSVGYTATATGTDYWVAIYNGDSKNSSVTSPAASEPVVITPATPMINTTQQPATAVVGSSIADKATVTGGYNATGSVTFELFSNAAGTGTPLFTSANVTIVNGVATSAGYTTAAAGTDYWVAIYNGDSKNSSVTSPAASEPVVITPSAPTITTTPGGTVGNGITINGTKFLDLTGDGFSTDDTPQSGVTINLYKAANSSTGLQTGAGGDTLVGTTTTGANGAYSFSVMNPGMYYVTESVPSGYLQTGGGPGGTAGNSYYTINAVAGNNYNGYVFDDFMIPTCLPNNITYKVTTPSGHSTTVTNLAGNTQQGDTVTATFSVPAGMTDTLSLVSYIAPTATWSDSNAYQQEVYQSATGTFAPGGPYTLTVKIPNDYYQIDFVCGQVINQLEPNQNGGAYGPDSANVLYHAENRFLSSDNSGTTAPSAGMLNSMAPTIPALASTANATALTDSAILSGGMNPTGSITFYLMAPGSTSSTPLTSAVYTDKVTVTKDGAYSTATGANPGGYVPTVSGAYQWVAVYSGDASNSGATSPYGSEPEVANVAPPACLSGTVYVDYSNNCCINSNDTGLSGVTVQLLSSTGTVLQSTTTNSSGVYSFSNIAPGTYTVYVPQSQSALTGYNAGKDAAGTVGGSTDGSVTATNTISQVTLAAGQQGINYNFGETASGQTLCGGDCGSIGFWCGQSGQNLMCCLNGSSNCTNLGNWLCNTYGNLYGKSCGTSNMSGKTNAQVCQYFQSICNNSSMQCQAQIMCAAINCYATNTSLCGSVASSYGFNCSSSGCGSKEFNVWNCGGAFGSGNYCTMTIQQLLQSCNSQASKGSCYGGSSSQISQACEVFTACNQAGGIGACS